jgi:3',5'-cyclic AMP phosphodiesterase CpdA
MRRIAHISDLHFGCTDPVVVEALVAELNADKPDLVIASGDFSMRARRREFREARAFLDRLESPWFAIPGNHDIPYWDVFERFIDPFHTYRAFIRKDLEPVWSDNEIGVVGINTARRAFFETNWSHGSISHEQIARTKERLEAFPPHLFKIVVGHHPFMPPPYAPDTRLVGRAEEALACFEQLGVKLVLAGHLHRGYASFRKPIIEGEAVVAQDEKPTEKVKTSELLVVQAASATSTRLRGEPNAYNRIKIEDGQARLEPRIWDGMAFVPATSAPEPVKAGEVPKNVARPAAVAAE